MISRNGKKLFIKNISKFTLLIYIFIYQGQDQDKKLRTLFLLILLLPFLELFIFFYLLFYFGLILSFSEVLVTFILGYYLFNRNKNLLLSSKFNQLNIFESYSYYLSKSKKSFFGLIGSIFLIMPGYVSDVFGLFLMFEILQSLIIKIFFIKLKTNFSDTFTFQNKNNDIVEGEFYNLNDKNEITNNKR